jgi:hypothetical protein
MSHLRIANANDFPLRTLHVRNLTKRIESQLLQDGFAMCCGVKVKQSMFSFRHVRTASPYKAWGGAVGACTEFDSVRDIASIIDEDMTRTGVVQNMQRGGKA